MGAGVIEYDLGDGLAEDQRGRINGGGLADVQKRATVGVDHAIEPTAGFHNWRGEGLARAGHFVAL